MPGDSRAPAANVVDVSVNIQVEVRKRLLQGQPAHLQLQISNLYWQRSHLLLSTSKQYAPLTWSKMIGCPPTELKARTGLLTPPGSSVFASEKICSSTNVDETAAAENRHHWLPHRAQLMRLTLCQMRLWSDRCMYCDSVYTQTPTRSEVEVSSRGGAATACATTRLEACR